MPTISLQVVPSGSPPALDARPYRHNEVLLPHIARRLGLADRPRRYIIARVRLLAKDHGFPLPKNPRFVNGQRLTGPASIDARSVWDKDAVDCWFEHDRPPVETAGLVAARREAVAADMRDRALRLVSSR